MCQTVETMRKEENAAVRSECMPYYEPLLRNGDTESIEQVHTSHIAWNNGSLFLNEGPTTLELSCCTFEV